MEFFSKYKTATLRGLGSFMLIVGFVINFWVTPKDGLSENDKAAARVARMEAKIKGTSLKGSKSSKKSDSKFLEELKKTQAKQLQYITIIVMILGAGSLGYSFISKKRG